MISVHNQSIWDMIPAIPVMCFDLYNNQMNWIMSRRTSSLVVESSVQHGVI